LDRNDELEKLREENFSLKITIDDLEQQLADCEADVRAEVVEMMNEQLQDSKEWYEGRIENLKQQLGLLEASNSKQAYNDADAQEKMNDLFDRINECEEEMKRMREEHEAEIEDKSAELLNMANMHEAEMEQAILVHQDELRTERAHTEQLLEENGVLRHQAAELRASHDTILSKYNELLSRYQQFEQSFSKESHGMYESVDTEDSESPPSEQGTSTFKKLPRDRCSDVASIAASVEIVSPKGKGGKWGFLRSPAKVALGEKSDSAAKSRSPLGKLNPNM
jgi:chromosome segregation ATPase